MFLLQPGQSVGLPAQLLLVRVQPAPGQPAPRLEAVVGVAGDQPHAQRQSAVREPLALTITEPTTVRLRPSDGSGLFGPGSTFSLSVQTEGADGSTVTLQGVDASGLRQRDLVILTPRGDEVLVSAVAQEHDLALTPTADRARMAAREHLGVPRLAPGKAVRMTVVVDVSASMRPLQSTGELEQALELFAGVGQVVAGPAAPAAACCGQTLTWLRSGSPERWANDVVRTAASRPAMIGFRSAQVPPTPPGDLVYLVTDAVPADLTPDRSDPLHLVLVGGSSPRSSHLPAAATVTVLPRTMAGSTFSDHEMGDVVRSLLVGFDPPSEEP